MTEPLDYNSPTTTPRPIFSLFAFLAIGIPLASILLISIFVMPRFEQIYKDFNTKLPTITQTLLDFGRFSRGFGIILLAAIPVATGFAVPAIGTNNASKRYRNKRIAVFISVVAILLIPIVAVMALLLPMFGIITGITSPPATRTPTPATQSTTNAAQ